MPYQIDTDSDGNIIPIHVFRILFPKAIKEQLVDTKNRIIALKTYNKTIIPQLGICNVMINNKNKQMFCRHFVVPGNVQVLLGM